MGHIMRTAHLSEGVACSFSEIWRTLATFHGLLEVLSGRLFGALCRLLSAVQFAGKMARKFQQLFFVANCHWEGHWLSFHRRLHSVGRGGRQTVRAHFVQFVQRVRIGKLVNQVHFVHDIPDFTRHVGNHTIRPAVFVDLALIVFLLGNHRCGFDVFHAIGTASTDVLVQAEKWNTLIGFPRKNDEEDELGECQKAANAVRRDEIEVSLEKAVNEPFSGDHKVGNAQRQRKRRSGTSANDHFQSSKWRGEVHRVQRHADNAKWMEHFHAEEVHRSTQGDADGYKYEDLDGDPELLLAHEEIEDDIDGVEHDLCTCHVFNRLVVLKDAVSQPTCATKYSHDEWSPTDFVCVFAFPYLPANGDSAKEESNRGEKGNDR
jgi:hypothetical protein